MAEVKCPTLGNILDTESCVENLAGMGSVVYVGVKSELKRPLTAEDNVYNTPEFESGKGLYRFDCKDESQKIEGSSLKNNKGFSLKGTFVIDLVNELVSKYGRSLNNLKIFLIFPENGKSQIMYDPIRNIKFEDGGIKTTTGAQASDERNTTCEAVLKPVFYPNLYVKEPTAGWDSLLASKASGASSPASGLHS